MNTNTNTNTSDLCMVDPKSGFCSKTKSFQCVRPMSPLPPLSQPLSAGEFCLSLLSSSPFPAEATAFLIESSSGQRLSFSELVSQTRSLCLYLRRRFPVLSPGDAAFILSPFSPRLPVLFLSLLSLGIVLSPSNPLSSTLEITHQLTLCRPSIAFSTSLLAHKLPQPGPPLLLLDSPDFLSALNARTDNHDRVPVTINQSDTAAIMYSSGTTGRVKGVLLTHRNLIALVSGIHSIKQALLPRDEEPTPDVSLYSLPPFHVFGFLVLLRAAAMGDTLVTMDKFHFEGMLRAVERYRVKSMPVSPPLVVALVKSDLVHNYDLTSLQGLGCGGAPLGKDLALRFKDRFPNVLLGQGYGMTETSGAAARMIDPEECEHHGSVGRLSEYMEGKIVDPATGETLSPGQTGELWVRGPTVMKGYVGDEKATAETLDSEGWLKTGDICYFDSDGFLYIVDRLKELIKYKAYQVPPAELEHLLHSNPEIADAAVIPYPDEEAGQIPMAYVVRKSGSNITEAQIMASIASQVAPYKKIRRVAFTSSIPKNPAGKILRRELVNHALSGGRSRL